VYFGQFLVQAEILAFHPDDRDTRRDRQAKQYQHPV
jgi:hypothetical protein